MTETPTPDSEPVDATAAPALLPSLLHGAPVTYSRGEQVVHPTRETYVAIVTAFKADGFNQLSDVCGVDYLTNATRILPDGVIAERYEVVANLLSHSKRARVRIRVQVPESDVTIPTLYDVYPGAEAMEREAYDLLGLQFTGHPDLSRILLPDNWEGHPLRKDYATGRIPVQFKEGTAR